MHRSGTNLLHDLLSLHPEVEDVDRPVWENFFLGKVHRLEAFQHSVAREWGDDWGLDESDVHELRKLLGDAIQQFLARGRDSRFVVTKTPSVHNLHRFFDFFPDACLLVLVRDGRAVVESGVRSFGWDRDMATRTWVHYARLVDATRTEFADRPGRFSVVRYEDLVRDPWPTLDHVFSLLGLDAGRIDPESVENLPVRGSSNLAEDGGDVHWRPVEPPPSFDPLSRFADWSPARHRRFNHLAAAELRLFGYEPRQETRSVLNRLRNSVRDFVDVRWRLRLAYRAWLRVRRYCREIRHERWY